MLESVACDWGGMGIQATCLKKILIIFRPSLLGLFFAKVRARLGETTIFIDFGQLFYHIVVEPNSYFRVSLTPCSLNAVLPVQHDQHNTASSREGLKSGLGK